MTRNPGHRKPVFSCSQGQSAEILANQHCFSFVRRGERNTAEVPALALAEKATNHPGFESVNWWTELRE